MPNNSKFKDYIWEHLNKRKQEKDFSWVRLNQALIDYKDWIDNIQAIFSDASPGLEIKDYLEETWMDRIHRVFQKTKIKEVPIFYEIYDSVAEDYPKLANLVAGMKERQFKIQKEIVAFMKEYFRIRKYKDFVEEMVELDKVVGRINRAVLSLYYFRAQFYQVFLYETLVNKINVYPTDFTQYRKFPTDIIITRPNRSGYDIQTFDQDPEAEKSRANAFRSIQQKKFQNFFTRIDALVKKERPELSPPQQNVFANVLANTGRGVEEAEQFLIGIRGLQPLFNFSQTADPSSPNPISSEIPPASEFKE